MSGNFSLKLCFLSDIKPPFLLRIDDKAERCLKGDVRLCNHFFILFDCLIRSSSLRLASYTEILIS